ncbi:hypothetical protein AALP_AAs41246U000100 [Arabis alpina]|uniref:TIR domain-containing protein n=1 Tax=Arabis alpina TaxID=50452 RepID=A0A087FWE5_ARAAL|nr:hypothetical protein AALP_AAs41246U000100 [Arabis alpina]
MGIGATLKNFSDTLALRNLQRKELEITLIIYWNHGWTYDVFPSFSGGDVRRSFLSHLLVKLHGKLINTFIDHGIERSRPIGPELLSAIRESTISIVIFSKKYASSTWCLNELVEIHKCYEELGQGKKNMKEMKFFTEYGDANRYQILQVIGKGSYGVVCAAIDTHMEEKNMCDAGSNNDITSADYYFDSYSVFMKKCRTGILSLFCAKAGATHVECSQMGDTAKEMVKSNKCLYVLAVNGS